MLKEGRYKHDANVLLYGLLEGMIEEDKGFVMHHSTFNKTPIV